jgi:hypothetical protein
MKLVSERTHVTEDVTLYRTDERAVAGRIEVGRLVMFFANREDPHPEHVEVLGGGGIERRAARMTAETLERMAASLRMVRARSGDNRPVCPVHGYRGAHEIADGEFLCAACYAEEAALDEPTGAPQ